MPNVVLDTDFLSSFLKIEQLDLIRDFFQTENLLVPTAVYREIAVTPWFPALAVLDWVQVRAIDLDQVPVLTSDREFSELGSGEQEAIALASSLTDSALLMSDRRALHCARRQRIHAVNIPAFLLAYRRSGQATVETIQELVDALREKDHYGFSQTVLDQLLN